MEIDKENILVRYKLADKIIEENVNQNQIAPVGKYSSKFNPNLHSSDEINNILYKNRKFIKANENQEKTFKHELMKINLKIKEIEGDGNCLYRALADQIYGEDSNYEILKAKCMDYLELEKEFFSQFIEGGKEKFDEYINMKRMKGVWGDDIEIQAASEIYNRPIEIYSHSKEPLKTFHENIKFSRLSERDEKKLPIRLSYHGKAHYNSLVPIDNYNQYKNNFLKTQTGVYENFVLEKFKLKNYHENASISNLKTDNLDIKSNLIESRTNFSEKSN